MMPQENPAEEPNTPIEADATVDTGSELTDEEPAGNGNKPSESSDTVLEDDPFEDPSEKKPVVKTVDPEAPKFDSDLDEWAVKAGHEAPETDRERKLLQNLRNGQRDYTKSRQAKQGKEELSGAIKDIGSKNPQEAEEISDPLERTVAELKADRESERTARLQSEFYQDKEIDGPTGKLMADILREKVDRAVTPSAKQKALEHWSHPDQLEDLYDLATARAMNAGTKETISEEAAKKERERIGQESKASGPVRNAKTVMPAKKVDITDPAPLWD